MPLLGACLAHLPRLGQSRESLSFPESLRKQLARHCAFICRNPCLPPRQERYSWAGYAPTLQWHSTCSSAHRLPHPCASFRSLSMGGMALSRETWSPSPSPGYRGPLPQTFSQWRVSQ